MADARSEDAHRCSKWGVACTSAVRCRAYVCLLQPWWLRTQGADNRKKKTEEEGDEQQEAVMFLPRYRSTSYFAIRTATPHGLRSPRAYGAVARQRSNQFMVATCDLGGVLVSLISGREFYLIFDTRHTCDRELTE